MNAKAVFAALITALAVTAPARAQMVLSQVVLDMEANKPPREDIEVHNAGSDRLYITVEPAEIIGAGTADERRMEKLDPDQLGLLVTPNRMILEPGERKLLRVAVITERGTRDRVYRLAIKPVTGDLQGENSALKVLIGYDALVIVRPGEMREKIVASRSGDSFTVTNLGNTNSELTDGRQCSPDGTKCTDLPGRRLYPGASWTQSIPADARVTYSIKTGAKLTPFRG